MTIQQLVETKAKNLSKLGQSDVIDVMSDYPEEFIRLLIRELEKKGFSIHEDSKKIALKNIRHEMSGSSLSKRNPVIDTRNPYEIELSSKDLKSDLEIRFRLSGNTLNVEKVSMSYATIPDFSIKLKNKSANDVIQQIVEKAIKVKEVADKKITSREEWEKSRAELAKKSKSKIENNLSRIVNKLGGTFSSETEGNQIKINLYPSRRVLGIPDDIFYKLKTEEFGGADRLSYSYQFDIMKKIWSQVYKAIDNSEYKIITAGLTDYLWFEIEIVEPERTNPRYHKTYKEVHDLMKNNIDDALEKGKEKSEKKSISDLRRTAVKQLLDKDSE